jgi:hypothetical protein
MQTYIDKHASFHPIGKDQTTKPIREKTDMPKYQVTLRSYSSIPNPRTFNNVSQDGGRVIKGSAVMGFSTDPQKCLEDASGDLRMMGCAIYYKKCQEVDTVATQVLVGAPNTIEEDIIKQTMDRELMALEKKLLLTNTDYKLSKSQLKKWISYAVVREFPAGMPGEGAEEKKQKQGTSNARLAHVLHVHQPDYERMKKLLAHMKELDIWHKHWGNETFTIKIPDERSPQGVKNKYIQMVQTHGLVQLSMGAALINGMINIDTSFTLRLLPGADGKPQPLTTTSVREVFSLMEINKKKVWICLLTGTHGMSTGYFLSVVEDIKEHVAAFVLCLGAQVYWWLRRRGCITEDVNRMIRHCFTLSQQQKITQSKYLKDLGHAGIDQSDADNIINAATTQGIYDLTLGLLDKEKHAMVVGKAHEASAITYGEAKEGALEANNFLLTASITTIHLKNEKKRDAKSVASEKTLAELVYSIDTLKVTEDDTDEERNGTEGSNNDKKPSASRRITIEGMRLLVEQKEGHVI